MSKEVTKVFSKLPVSKQELILRAAYEFEMLNQQAKLLTSRKDKIFRPIIEPVIDSLGIEDSDGHKHIIVDNIEMIRTKKTSRIMNTIAAEQILEEAGLLESCQVEVVTYELDEGKIIEAFHAGLLSAANLDKMFDNKITWATSVHVDDATIKEVTAMRKAIEKGEGEILEIESN